MGNRAIQLIHMSPLSLHHSTIVIVQLEGDLILFKNQFVLVVGIFWFPEIVAFPLMLCYITKHIGFPI